MMIVWIDMHIRDERLLEYLRKNNLSQIPADDMAQEFRCHPNTIRRMLKRLESAGYIRIHRKMCYRGYTYEVIEDANA